MSCNLWTPFYISLPNCSSSTLATGFYPLHVQKSITELTEATVSGFGSGVASFNPSCTSPWTSMLLLPSFCHHFGRCSQLRLFSCFGLGTCYYFGTWFPIKTFLGHWLCIGKTNFELLFYSDHTLEWRCWCIVCVQWRPLKDGKEESCHVLGRLLWDIGPTQEPYRTTYDPWLSSRVAIRTEGHAGFL